MYHETMLVFIEYAFLGIVGIGVILFLLMIPRYIAFLLVNSWSGHLAWLRKQGGFCRSMTRSIVTSFLAECILLPSYLLHFFSSKQTEDGTPIVLVHGLHHSECAWLLFKRRLQAQGFQNITTYGYKSVTGEFAEAVAGLNTHLDERLAANPGRKVVLIGHSLGGMVIRRAVGAARYRDRVEKIVTLGTPHHGSALAWCAGNHLGRDLIPGRTISRLVAESEQPDCPMLSMYTFFDDYVMPLPMLQVARDGWREQVCSPMGHVWMLYSREVVENVVDFINE